ncbi:MAG TPA: CPXCG motif-containing cysteine-rich protein [Gemmatimonadaceae bacterium]|nr:CPXCG motif-containing cysteine-rich protein [Gemmatimonadaceae bacterium]
MRFAPDFEPVDPDDGNGESEPDLDEEFPLGDGTADLDADVVCPYCGEAVTLALDAGSGESQEYVEDCPVCCQPWKVVLRYSRDGAARVTVDRL